MGWVVWVELVDGTSSWKTRQQKKKMRRNFLFFFWDTKNYCFFSLLSSHIQYEGEKRFTFPYFEGIFIDAVLGNLPVKKLSRKFRCACNFFRGGKKIDSKCKGGWKGKIYGYIFVKMVTIQKGSIWQFVSSLPLDLLSIFLAQHNAI